MVAEFQPSTEAEFDMVENLTSSYWRQRRTWVFIAQCLNIEIRAQIAAAPHLADLKPSERAAIGFRHLADSSNSLELSRRYDAGLERQYYRALQSLRDRKPNEKNYETNPTTDQLPLFE